ncbi:MAG: nitroreductase family protein [Rhodothermaceae bacterium]
MIEKLIKLNRTYRRFYQNHKISDDNLLKLVNYARLTGSAANLQPLKYYISNNEKNNNQIFSKIAWAGYLSDWAGPEEGEKPSSYIVILGDTKISKQRSVDVGIAAQSIMLGAVEMELGGCMFGAIKRDELKSLLGFDEHLEIELVIALGKPKEQIILEDVESNNVKYWRDENQVHHVPKRKIEEIIIKTEK